MSWSRREVASSPTAGAVPLDAEGNLVGPGDRRAQARQTLENLALALEAVGATARHVIKTTVYVVADDRTDLVEVGMRCRNLAWPRRRAR